jgi:hypothetical protein
VVETQSSRDGQISPIEEDLLEPWGYVTGLRGSNNEGEEKNDSEGKDMISNDDEEASTSSQSTIKVATFGNITTKIQREKEILEASATSEGGNEEELDSIVKGLKQEKEKIILDDDERASTCSQSDNEEEDFIFEVQEEKEKILNDDKEPIIISSQGTNEGEDSIYEGVSEKKEIISNEDDEFVNSSQNINEEEDSIFEGLGGEKDIIISNDDEEPSILSLSSSKRVSFGNVTYKDQEKEISDDDDEKYSTSSRSSSKYVSFGEVICKVHEEEKKISNEYCTSCISDGDSIDEEGSSFFCGID